MFIKNKRGDIAVVVLVILALISTSAALFSFVTSSGGVEMKISDFKFIDSSYQKQNLAEFYIYQAGEDAIIKTYKEFADDSVPEYDYIKNRQKEGNNAKFGEIWDNLDERFSNRFKENFKTEFENYEFEEGYLKGLKELISKESFTVLFDGETLKVDIDDWQISNSLDNIGVVYFPEISSEFNLRKIGLHSFEKIYEVKEKCLDEGIAKSCFDNYLGNFESSIGSSNLVSLTSKKEFLAENTFEKISFSFIPE